jgi:hypothetical protein
VQIYLCPLYDTGEIGPQKLLGISSNGLVVCILRLRLKSFVDFSSAHALHKIVEFFKDRRCFRYMSECSK